MQCRQCNAQLPAGASFCHVCGASDPIASVQTSKDSLIGRTLNKQYRIVRKLGEGGFGAVYEADEPRFERKVAIKTIHPKLLENPVVLERFRREGMAAGKLEHPAAVKVFNLGETDDGVVFLVMEFIEGETLAAHLEKSGALSPKATLALLEPICEVLAEAHQKGIIHRDLKPHNIMLTPKRGGFVPKLLDFGISKVASAGRLTQTMVSIGTPAYMAPEQWEEGKKADARTDLYALGLIVYQCLTGAFPFEADTAPGWMKKHCLEAPKPLQEIAPQLPVSLCNAVMKAIEKDPEKRYPDALAFFQSLSSSLPEAAKVSTFPDPNAKTVAQDSSVVPTKPAPPPSVAPSTLPGVSAKQRPFVLFGLGTLAVLVVVGLIYLMVQPTTPPTSPDPTKNKTTPPVSTPAPPPTPAPPQKNATWQWLNPTPQGNRLSSIARLSDREIFAVGNSGTVVRSQDGGRTWTLVPRIVAADLYYLWGLPSGQLYAVGDEGTVITSSDRGETWSILTAPALDGPYVSFWASAPDDLYLLGHRVLFRSIDQGKTWTPLTLPAKFTDNPTWKLKSIWGSSPKDIYVVGEVGMAFHSIDQGVTWETFENLPAANAEYGIAEVTGSPDEVFLLREGAPILETLDQGKTWTPIPWPGDVPLGLYISNTGHLRAADGTQVYYSPDKLGWQVAYSSGLSGFTFYDFLGSDKSFFAVGENGGIASSLDGVRWELTSKTVSDDYLRSVWGTSPEQIFAVGAQGAILQSLDAGKTWTLESAFDPGNDRLQQHWDDVWGSPEGKVYAVGSYYLAERTKDGWKGHLIEPRFGLVYGTIWGTSQKLYIGGEHGSLRASTDGGVTWTEERPANPSEGTIQAIWGASPNELYAAGTNLLLFSTGDGVWEPKTPPVIGSFDLYSIGGAGDVRIAVGAELKTVEFLQPPSPPGVPPLPPIPPRTDPAGSFMFRSDDAGKTWKRITQIPDANSLNAVWAVSPEEFYLIASNGSIYHSPDAGKTWQQELNAGRSLQELWGTSGVLYTVGQDGGILQKQ